MDIIAAAQRRGAGRGARHPVAPHDPPLTRAARPTCGTIARTRSRDARQATGSRWAATGQQRWPAGPADRPYRLATRADGVRGAFDLKFARMRREPDAVRAATWRPGLAESRDPGLAPVRSTRRSEEQAFGLKLRVNDETVLLDMIQSSVSSLERRQNARLDPQGTIRKEKAFISRPRNSGGLARPCAFAVAVFDPAAPRGTAAGRPRAVCTASRSGRCTLSRPMRRTFGRRLEYKRQQKLCGATAGKKTDSSNPGAYKTAST
jgi:hypothetical protein